MNQPKTLLDKEIFLLHPLLTALLLCALSGLAIYVSHSLAWWSQFNILGHVFVGVIFSLLCLPYLYRHFKRTLGIRRPLLIISGIIVALFIIGYIYISFHIAIVGHKETQRSLLLVHRYGSLVIIALLLLHIMLHKWARQRKDVIAFHSLKSFSIRQNTEKLITYIVVIAIATFSYWLYYSPPELDHLTKNYEYSYGKHPFRPSQTETPGSKFIASKQIAESNDCGQCHKEITRQWFSSIHRLAASDPTYVTNINLLEKKKGISSTRYCEGCHSPVALLTGQLTPGGKHGGVKNTIANYEGVSCLSCHRITKAVHLDGVASYLYEPATEYIFQYSDSVLLKKINHFLTNISARQHRKEMAPAISAQPTLCATCHAQFMDKDMNDWGWVKMQDEYKAWLNSPYSQQHQQSFASKKLTRCQDCHMPLVSDNSDPSANDDGMVMSHRFAAANTMMPFLNNDTEQLEKTINFLQSNKMHITIQPPNRKNATQSTLNLDESLRLHKETPFYYYLGEKIKLNVVVSNTGVGHDFPGGTIDINEAWVHLVVRDIEGRIVYQSGTLDKEDNLETAAHRYLAIAVNRQGKEVWKHDLFNMTGETYRNIIKAGSSDVASYEFTLPQWVKGPLVVDALLKYRKLNTRYARWALKEQYQPLPVVIMARDSLKIETRLEPRVISETN